jgi:hypothetical protein
MKAGPKSQAGVGRLNVATPIEAVTYGQVARTGPARSGDRGSGGRHRSSLRLVRAGSTPLPAAPGGQARFPGSGRSSGSGLAWLPPASRSRYRQPVAEDRCPGIVRDGAATASWRARRSPGVSMLLAAISKAARPTAVALRMPLLVEVSWWLPRRSAKASPPPTEAIVLARSVAVSALAVAPVEVRRVR